MEEKGKLNIVLIRTWIGKICGKSIATVSCDLNIFKRGLFVSNKTVLQYCSKKEKTSWEQHFCTNSHVLIEPLAQGGSFPIQGKWKKHNLELLVHTDSKKVSSSFECLSKSLLLHHLFLLQNPHTGVVCSIELSLPHVPASVLAFFICLF